ncbi:MAG TPA: DUF4350 domain-containing protein [Chitinophagaceae bacterium]|nr:DUF4350 domain-containing protein [Chitinophagaceae bacterium]
MKRFSPTLFLPLLLFILCCSCNKLKKPETDWQPTLKRDGKHPYDTYLGFQSLWYYFPGAEVRTLYRSFDFEELNNNAQINGQDQSLIILIGTSLTFSNQEWMAIKDFMRNGNEVLLLSSHIDDQILDQLHLKQKAGQESRPLSEDNPGSANMHALSLDVLPDQRFGFWGRDLKGYFAFVQKKDSLAIDFTEEISSGPARTLGAVHYAKDSFSAPDFIQFTIGKGHLTLVATPLVLTNYFLLQEKNRLYADHLWQSVQGNIRHIYWGNYTERVPSDSSFNILWRNKATRMALILVFIAALIYLLFEIKRRQRAIPVVPPVSNTSVAFIETVGLLYYNKGDNQNLAHKMEQHFLDWVRTRLHLSTAMLNDDFAMLLSTKAGVPVASAHHLLSLLHQLHLDGASVSNDFLFDFYRTIQEFYKANDYGIRK